MQRLIVLQHVERESGGLFAKIAFDLGLRIITCRLYLGDPIPEVREDDILLVMGGPMGIRDIDNPLFPWFLEEIKVLEYALSKQIRVIGVCLGAQLIAYIYGCKVEPLLINKQERAEVGWSPIYLCNNKYPYCLLFDQTINVLHWHGDRIVLNNDSKIELIASSNICKEQLFRINSVAYGIQFHIEVEDHMFKEWIRKDEDFIGKALGHNASNILLAQQNKYSEKTFYSRVKFIKGLYDLLKI